MRYVIYKIIFAVIFVILIHITVVFPVYANSPILKGRVINKWDNTSVPGVWVKWQDRKGSIRYAMTDQDGNFAYPSWQTMDRSKECSNSIDTNLDGVNDSYQAVTAGSPCDEQEHDFGCMESPHKWSVVKPQGWNGVFTDAGGDEEIKMDGYNNGPGDIPIGILYWIPSCNCHSMDYNGDLAPGKTVTFTTIAKVENPDKNHTGVNNMVYQVKRDGIEITPVPGEIREIPASGPVPATIGGAPVYLYTTNWDYLIPTEGQGIVTYNIRAQINCAVGTAQIPTTPMLALGETSKRTSLFGSLSKIVYALFNKSDVFGPQIVLSAPLPQPSVTPTTAPVSTPIVTTVKSLQLGSFYPPEMIGCNEMSFKINYDLYK